MELRDRNSGTVLSSASFVLALTFTSRECNPLAARLREDRAAFLSSRHAVLAPSTSRSDIWDAKFRGTICLRRARSKRAADGPTSKLR